MFVLLGRTWGILMRQFVGHGVVAVVASLATYFLVKKFEDKPAALVMQPPVMPAKWEIHPPVDFTVAAQMAMPAVVHIKTQSGEAPAWHRFFWGPQNDSEGDEPPYPFFGQGTGSGVIISPDGYIVTSNHVIEKASRIEVVLYDNRSFTASLVGADPSTDLALLKINAEGLPYLEYGDSDALRVGDWVLAVGNPFNLTSTVTAGIVSAKGRSLQLLNDRFRVESFIQTDAAVNPGNSGGALVNIEGKLVGINTAIASITGTFAGYSFAVPVSIVKKVVEDLRTYGKVQRALLGVSITNVTAELQKEQELAVSQGAYIRDVYAGSAAEEAGIQSGDVIVEVDGRPVRSASELQELIARHRPGDKVKIKFYRKQQVKEVTVRLKGRSAEETSITEAPGTTSVAKLGVALRPLQEKEKKELGVEGGVKVVEVYPGPLKEVGVRKGFVIMRIDKKPVKTVEDVENILADASGGILLEGLYSKQERAYYAISLE
jgi:Do/DeqQ family serine protease